MEEPRLSNQIANKLSVSYYTSQDLQEPLKAAWAAEMPCLPSGSRPLPGDTLP